MYSEDERDNQPHDIEGGDEGLTIRVVAPATLAEGYTFDVLVDDQPYRVEVPQGGVQEGEEFDVPYFPQRNSIGEGGRLPENLREPSFRHYDDEETTAFVLPENFQQKRRGANRNEDKERMEKIRESGTFPLSEGDEEDEEGDLKKEPKTGAPMGRWRTHLFTCCDVITQSTFWMGMCCTPVLVAQLITRLGLTWNGQDGTPEEKSLSFNRIVVGMLIALALWKIPVIGGFCLVGYYCFIVGYVGSNVRSHLRQKYEIPNTIPDKLGGPKIDDKCCMLFCGCCSAIQMSRHTHDDKEYPGHGCTTTGVGMHAPKIV